MAGRILQTYRDPSRSFAFRRPRQKFQIENYLLSTLSATGIRPIRAYPAWKQILWDTRILRGSFPSITRKGQRKGMTVRRTTRRLSALPQPVVDLCARIDIVLSATFLSVFRPLSAAAPSHPLSRFPFFVLVYAGHDMYANSIPFWNLAIRPTCVESEVAPSCSLGLPTFSSLFLLYFGKDTRSPSFCCCGFNGAGISYESSVDEELRINSKPKLQFNSAK